MNVPRLMTLFHLSFTAFGILALLLMATGVLVLDWLIVGIIVVAIVLNGLFSRLWHEENTAKISETPKTTPRETNRIFPMVSIVVSVYDQEQSIAQIVRKLFKLASDYRGPSEIIIVDDGSLDNTYESASTAIELIHKEYPNMHARAIKHLAHLGTTEATKTGVNKAMGEFLAILDPNTLLESFSLNTLVDAASSAERATPTPDHSLLQREVPTTGSRRIRLYSAEAFRSLLNEKQNLKP
jgi:cellulose synthase/poly-beta-1,6-N-acetylglucosamine synthase-like glycosyltransferase